MKNRAILPVTLSDLAEHICSVSSEANLTGRSEEEVIAGRLALLELGVTEASLRACWRKLNIISVEAYCRLTGEEPRVVRRSLQHEGHFVCFDLFNCRRCISIWRPVLEGFSFTQIERARRGEMVFLQIGVQSYAARIGR